MFTQEIIIIKYIWKGEQHKYELLNHRKGFECPFSEIELKQLKALISSTQAQR